MMLRCRIAGLAALLCLFLLIALPAFTDSQARIVRLSDVEGNVQIDRHTGQGVGRAIVNMPITQGAVLTTGMDGRAEVEFEDGAIIHLVPNSGISFKQLSLHPSGEKASRIDVAQGAAYFDIRRAGKDQFIVTVADRELPVAKSARFRVIVDGENLRLAVFDGELSLENSGKQLKVKKGEELTLNRADGTYLASHIQPSEFDTWARKRKQYHDRYFAASSYKTYPYYGRGDLGFYGGWYSVPGYGSLWRPYNVGFGWDPFAGGCWTWYPGLGYIWVSSYNWGWLPYRYGSWAYVPGWGWGWSPYGNWTRWTNSPGVVNSPPGFKWPVPPSTSPASPPRVSVPAPPTPPRVPRRPDDTFRVESQRPPGVVLPPARPPRVERGVVNPPDLHHSPATFSHPLPQQRSDVDARTERRQQPSLGGRQSDSGAPQAAGTRSTMSPPVAPAPRPAAAPRAEPASRSDTGQGSGRNTR